MVNVRIGLAYAGICAIWGTTWLGIKVALTGLPPMGAAGVRFVVAAAFLYALGLFSQRHRGTRPSLRVVFVLAATLFGLNYALTYFAETHLASGLVAVLFGTLPFFVFGFGALMVGESVGWRTVGGAVLALGGVAVISLTGEGGELIYALAALAAAAISAFANVYLKRHAASDPFLTLPPAMLVAGVVLLAASLVFERIDLHAAFALPSVLATLYLSVVGSAIAFYLNHWLLQRLASWVVGLSALIIPVIAVIVGTVVAHERFGPREIAGAILVIGGVWLALSQRAAAAEIAADAA